MSRWNYKPEWVPVDDLGESWRFVSYKGRYLGDVSRMDSPDGETVYLSAKLCCPDVKEHKYLYSAACRVETVLYCTECKKSCLAPKSN